MNALKEHKSQIGEAAFRLSSVCALAAPKTARMMPRVMKNISAF